VLGVDSAPRAIEIAQEKARERGVPAEFRVHDVLDLPSLGRGFDTVIDAGLFHTLSDEDRPRHVRSLAAVLRPGGRCFMIGFSELEPPGYGPRRVTQADIRDAFAGGGGIDRIRPAAFESRIREGARAWLSSIVRL
jgi:cyclopropane fatty-acyl-phospholipid synthase-like methyltransferase